MRSINRLTILGHVGKVTNLGKIAKIDIATNRQWKDNEGKTVTATDWVTVTVLDEAQAEWIGQNTSKGSQVHVEARISNSSYEKDGVRIYTTDVIATLFNLLGSTQNNQHEEAA